jgi:ADP-heptose:LPS heptosyltransferase
LCAVPALRALRAALPDSAIHLIGLPWAASFVDRFSRYVDGFTEFPGYPGLPERQPDLAALPAFLSCVQKQGFDLVIQMHGSGEITNPLVLLFDGRATAGFFRPGHLCPDPNCFLPYPDSEPEPRRHLSLMRFLGAPPRGEHLEFPVTDEDGRNARRALANLPRTDRYACLHPGARAADRRWSTTAFARVGDAVARHDVDILLTGVEEEASLTADVARQMHAPALDLAGRLPLGTLAAVIQSARLTICNDTGVSHIADALGAPSVVIYTGSDPARWAPLDGTLHRVIRGRDDHEAVAHAIAEAESLLSAEGLHAA